MSEIALVVTSINSPNQAIKDLAQGAVKNDWNFILVGDKKSPADFVCEGVNYYSLESQLKTGFTFAEKCPVGHYARKNIGYLLAASQSAQIIVETDDDNLPREGFWARRERSISSPLRQDAGWVNVYRYFSDALIWPRGLPLDRVTSSDVPYEALSVSEANCPIQQGLADENPDVDAIYRLLLPLPQNFMTDRSVTLGRGAWCPFNSQNTTWWKEAFPLMYLPAYCSFRMTDIWRSFVAQRIAWECGWGIHFHGSTVWQERNEHDLMRDFKDEVPGYLSNALIARKLEELPLSSGTRAIEENLIKCYGLLVNEGLIGNQEMALLDAWLKDLTAVQ